MGLFGSVLKAFGGNIIGGIVSGHESKKAVKKATKAQLEAIAKATGGLNTAFDASAAQFDPYIDAGTDALGGLRTLLGLDGAEGQQGAIDGLKASPLFQTLFNTGRDSILAAGSATGGLRGGNINDALYDNGTETLAKVIQQQLASLGGLAGQGLDATGNLAGLREGNASSIANLTTGAGNAQAGSILNRQAIDNNMFSGIRASVANALAAGGGAGAIGAGGAPFSISSALGSLFGSGGISGGSISNAQSAGGGNPTGYKF